MYKDFRPPYFTKVITKSQKQAQCGNEAQCSAGFFFFSAFEYNPSQIITIFPIQQVGKREQERSQNYFCSPNVKDLVSTTEEKWPTKKGAWGSHFQEKTNNASRITVHMNLGHTCNNEGRFVQKQKSWNKNSKMLPRWCQRCYFMKINSKYYRTNVHISGKKKCVYFWRIKA